MKKLLFIGFVLLAYSGYAGNKLYKNDSVIITTARITYPAGVVPFVIDTTGKPGYADFSSIENWSLYGGGTNLNTKEIKDEIDTLVTEKTFASCTDAEKDVASEWFVVNKSDRDTRHTDDQQEENAERLVRNIFPGLSEKDIIFCINSIKNADKTIINNTINAQSLPFLLAFIGDTTGFVLSNDSAIVTSTSNVILDTEGGVANDTLTVLVGAIGQIVYISTRNPDRDIAILDEGKFILPVNRILNHPADIIVLKAVSATEWKEISFSNNN